jgi:hypothetical protein
MSEATNSLSRKPFADNCCSISYGIPNTPQSAIPITQGQLSHDQHSANNREPNTTEAIA